MKKMKIRDYDSKLDLLVRARDRALRRLTLYDQTHLDYYESLTGEAEDLEHRLAKKFGMVVGDE